MRTKRWRGKLQACRPCTLPSWLGILPTWLFQPRFQGRVDIPSSRHAGASSKGASETAAEDYLELILANEWQEGGLEKALLQGNHLLEAAGSVSEAALVLRAVGRVRLGDHFAELGDPRLDDAIDSDLLAYARAMADKGVRACYEGDRSARDS